MKLRGNSPTQQEPTYVLMPWWVLNASQLELIKRSENPVMRFLNLLSKSHLPVDEVDFWRKKIVNFVERNDNIRLDLMGK